MNDTYSECNLPWASQYNRIACSHIGVSLTYAWWNAFDIVDDQNGSQSSMIVPHFVALALLLNVLVTKLKVPIIFDPLVGKVQSFTEVSQTMTIIISIAIEIGGFQLDNLSVGLIISSIGMTAFFFHNILDH